MSIRIGIMGYGNLGRGVECALANASDMQLCAIFTRRDPASLTPLTAGVPVASAADIAAWQGKLDVVILCGGSATDLPTQTPACAALFNVVDSFDTHANIPAHFAAVDTAAKAASKTAIVSVGWDPGMFSVNRLYAEAILPNGQSYTFWGKGVSQGHSDAIRRIEGVADARQYTIPVESALQAVRSGSQPDLTTRQKHTRECFVVAKAGADLDWIRQQIVTMPNYFDAYDTTVHFITQQQLDADHAGLPHGGRVLHSGATGTQGQHHHVIEYSLQLDSNPEFTASVLVAYARAAHRLNASGDTGCKTVLDIAPALLSPHTAAQLRQRLV